MEKKPTQVTYKCYYCSAVTTRPISMGPPRGKSSCPKQPRDEKGNYQPHFWVEKNRH